MSRLALTTGTSPLWGAVPRWEVGVGDLFRDVSKRALCSLIIWPDGPTSLGHSSSHPCRSGRSPWPAPGGRFVRDHRPWEQADILGQARGPCAPLANGDWLGRGPLALGSTGQPGGKSGRDDGATQVDSDAGAESSGFRGKGAARGCGGPAGDRCLLPMDSPPLGQWRRRGTPGAAFSARRRAPHGFRWGELLAKEGGSPPCLAADIDGCRGFQRR